MNTASSLNRFMAVGDRDNSTPPRRDAPVPDVSSGLRVLIVEDESIIALDIESALSEAGFEVVGSVDTEAEAVSEALRLKPDLVLVDISLRDGDGIAAAAAIQASTMAKIVFLSGNSDPHTLSAATKLNPAGFIRKPFINERLAGLVREALVPRN